MTSTMSSEQLVISISCCGSPRYSTAVRESAGPFTSHLGPRPRPLPRPSPLISVMSGNSVLISALTLNVISHFLDSLKKTIRVKTHGFKVGICLFGSSFQIIYLRDYIHTFNLSQARSQSKMTVQSVLVDAIDPIKLLKMWVSPVSSKLSQNIHRFSSDAINKKNIYLQPRVSF